MEKIQKRLWFSHVLLFLFTIFLLLFIDMKGELFDFSIIVSYLIFGFIILSGITISILLLIRKTKAKWVCYAFIAFYIIGLSPLFTHNHPDNDHLLMLLVAKHIWPEEYSNSPNIPKSLTEITYLKLMEIEKSQLDLSKRRRVIIFNPNGFKDKTWIAYCKSRNLKSSLNGFFILWYI